MCRCAYVRAHVRCLACMHTTAHTCIFALTHVYARTSRAHTPIHIYKQKRTKTSRKSASDDEDVGVAGDESATRTQLLARLTLQVQVMQTHLFTGMGAIVNGQAPEERSAAVVSQPMMGMSQTLSDAFKQSF